MTQTCPSGADIAEAEAFLAAHPEVEAFGHPSDASGWGATVASLRPREGR